MYDALGDMIDLENPVADDSLNDGLVAWYMALPGLDGGSKLYDLRGLNPGTLTNMAFPGTATSGWGSTTRPGGWGEVRFDGSDDWVNCGPVSSSLGGEFTVSFWAKWNATNNYYFPVTKTVGTGASTNGFEFRNEANTQLSLVGKGGNVIWSGHGVVTAGQWLFVCGTFDGTTSRLYADGRQVASGVLSLGYDSTSTDVQIGTRGDFYTYFLGAIDDARVYNRALSAAEVAALYADSRTGYRRTLRRVPRRVWVAASVTPPVAAFSGTPLSGTAPLSVAFTDASTNTPTAWLWEKNDGGGWQNFASGSTTQNPTESFAAGTWSVRLTATNAGGSDSETKTSYLVVATPLTPTNPEARWASRDRAATWARPVRTARWATRDRSATWASGV